MEFAALVSFRRKIFLLFSKERFSTVLLSYIDTKLDGFPLGKREANNRQPIMQKWTVMGNMQIILILRRWWVRADMSFETPVYCKVCCCAWTESQLLWNAAGLTRKLSALSSGCACCLNSVFLQSGNYWLFLLQSQIFFTLVTSGGCWSRKRLLVTLCQNSGKKHLNCFNFCF